MNYLKSIKPFQLISTIVQKAKEKVSRDSQKSGSQTPTNPSSANPQNEDSDVDYDNVQSFLVSLRKVSSQRQQGENILRRKIDLFQRVEIEPHYLQPADNKKLLEFQFHLGSDIFLQRVQHLQQQNMDIAAVMQEVVSRRKNDALAYLKDLTVLGEDVEKLLVRTADFRARLKQITSSKVYAIWLLLKRKNTIKNKLRLLKKMKEKNQMAFIEITNIDQAFATQQTRAKIYDKIKKLTQIEKSTYISIVRNKLISTALKVKGMVQTGIAAWISNTLKQNQIQKIVVLIYYIMEKSVYRQNNITLDFKQFDKSKLRQCISSINEWKNFTYVKNMVTKQKINQFLYILSANIK